MRRESEQQEQGETLLHSHRPQPGLQLPPAARTPPNSGTDGGGGRNGEAEDGGVREEKEVEQEAVGDALRQHQRADAEEVAGGEAAGLTSSDGV